MLLPQSRKKSRKVDPPPRLDASEQARHSEAWDQALTIRAKREQEEVAAERARFELTRDRIVFGFQLALAVVMTAVVMTALALNPEPIPMALLGAGGVGGLLLRRRQL